MFSIRVKQLGFLICFCLTLSIPGLTQAQTETIVRGTVLDPLGSIVPGAEITLRQNGKDIVHGNSDGSGTFVLKLPAGGNYSIRVKAAGFAELTQESVFV